jgi:hypothetical protein
MKTTDLVNSISDRIKHYVSRISADKGNKGGICPKTDNVD